MQTPIKALRKYGNALYVQDEADIMMLAFVASTPEMFDWVAKTISQFHKKPVLFESTDKEVQG